MRTIVYFTLFIFVLFSCKKNPVSIQADVSISYKNLVGHDLLDSTVKGYFSIGEVKIFNINNGKRTERFYSNYDNPRMCWIYRESESHTNYVRVGIETDTTLVVLNQNITDTIVCSIDRAENNFIVKKVWYNSVLKWEYGTKPAFTIVK